MSRHKVNKPRRPRPLSLPYNTDEPSIEMTPEVVEFFAAMKKMAQNSFEAAVERLRDLDVPQSAIDQMEVGVRAMCVAEIWEMDLENIFTELVNSGGETIGVRDAIMEKLVGAEIVPRNEDGSIKH